MKSSERRQIVPAKPVSIIICAHNEAANLATNLPAILNQNYPGDGMHSFEVILVDDYSTDETKSVLDGLKKQYPSLTCLKNTGSPGKKAALKTGVMAATYDWLLFTDADCQPASNVWISGMVAPLAAGKEIVAGYSGHRRQGGLLNAFIRCETLHTFLQYSTYLAAGTPYMVVGRNYACKKDVFLKVQADAIWNSLPSGDDDLLMNAAGTKSNTAVVMERECFTFSEAKSTFADYVHQKKRHMSTGKLYKGHIKILLGCYSGAHAAVWLYFCIMLFSVYRDWVLIIMAVRCWLFWVTLASCARRTGETRLLPFFPLFDLLWMIYNFAFAHYVLKKNKLSWK